MIGKVIEVFIPNNDGINSTKIGFKIDVDNKIIEIIQEQDEINADIYKDDLVEINKQIIDGKEFIDIIRIDEDEYE